jgi:hypothetical protein
MTCSLSCRAGWDHKRRARQNFRKHGRYCRDFQGVGIVNALVHWSTVVGADFNKFQMKPIISLKWVSLETA